MEENNAIKMSLSTFLLIIAIIVIIIMGAFIVLNNNSTRNQNYAELQTQPANVKETASSKSSTDSQQTVEKNTVDNTLDNTKTETDVSSNSNIVKQQSSVSKSQILSYYKEKLTIYSDSNHQYSVVDINNDDIPELFIFVTGTVGNEIISYTSVYTYDENKGNKSNNYIIDIGTLNGRIDNNTILYKMNNGSLLSVYGHMGYETTSYFKLENDWLVRTEFSSKETSTYMSGDIKIQFKPCSDTSLIDNFN